MNEKPYYSNKITSNNNKESLNRVYFLPPIVYSCTCYSTTVGKEAFILPFDSGLGIQHTLASWKKGRKEDWGYFMHFIPL